jgi:hypothetical protein
MRYQHSIQNIYTHFIQIWFCMKKVATSNKKADNPILIVSRDRSILDKNAQEVAFGVEIKQFLQNKLCNPCALWTIKILCCISNQWDALPRWYSVVLSYSKGSMTVQLAWYNCLEWNTIWNEISKWPWQSKTS